MRFSIFSVAWAITIRPHLVMEGLSATPVEFVVTMEAPIVALFLILWIMDMAELAIKGKKS